MKSKEGKMIVIIEIGLTVWACIKLHQAKKPWGLGLLPLCVSIPLSFLIGFVLGALNLNSMVNIRISTLPLEGLTIAVLALIIFLTRKYQARCPYCGNPVSKETDLYCWACGRQVR